MHGAFVPCLFPGNIWQGRCLRSIVWEFCFPVWHISLVMQEGNHGAKCALARLLFKKCSLILVDEPTGFLDAENAALVMGILHEMNDSGQTVIMVTHSEEIVKQAECVVEVGRSLAVNSNL